jgi:nucleoid DNA-binding protein
VVELEDQKDSSQRAKNSRTITVGEDMKKKSRRGQTVYMASIAKKAGLYQLTCEECGHSIKAFDALKIFFRIVIEECRSGNIVHLTGFGNFNTKVWRKRDTETGKVRSRLWLAFKQSTIVSDLLNRKGI